jgi:nucleotide-binding universal stress UspA family protein
MFKHIMIATDGSELGHKAEAAGLTLAKELNAQVTAVTVTEPWHAFSMEAFAERRLPNPVAGFDESVAADANRILWQVTETAKRIGVACTTMHAKDKYPAEGILEAAKSRGCDLIVMASHGRRGIAGMLLGSQTVEVVTLSSIPVLVCR